MSTISLPQSALTAEEQALWDDICSRWTSEIDRSPQEIVDQDYDGDIRAYLAIMKVYYAGRQ